MKTRNNGHESRADPVSLTLFLKGVNGGPAVSDASAAAVADGHCAPVDDDGNIAPAAAVPEHLVEEGGISDDVPVVHRPSFRREGLTGPVGVGSGGFSVDDDGF